MWKINTGTNQGATASQVNNVLGVVEAAITYWSRYIDFSAANIAVNVNFISLGGLTLAQAGTSFTEISSNLFQADTILELQDGIDRNGSDSDIDIDVNLDSITANEFYYGGFDSAGPGYAQFDLFTVLVHEIGHGLGFISLLDQFEMAVFDTYIGGGPGSRVFGGPNAISVYGGPVPLDDDASHTSEAISYSVMTPSIAAGSRVLLSALDVAFLEDIGAPILQPTAGADYLYGYPTADNVTLLGGNDYYRALAGNDSVNGGAGGDTILGDDGSDTLIGDDGDDYLVGGGQNDQLYAGSGNDRADGGDGADIVRSGPGSDTILGGAGDDTLGASNKSDLLRGEAGADLMLGSNGNDRLFGGDGDDTMLGGNGRDTLWGDAGADRLVGGDQVDTASYSTAGAGVSVRLWAEDGLAGDALGDTLIEVENLIGSLYADTLAGSHGANRIDGGSGNDSISGFNGDDNLIGSAGNDTLTGGNDNDTFIFFVDEGNDVITDFVAGAATDDVIRLIGFGPGFDSFAEIFAAASQSGLDTVINLGAGDSITLVGVAKASLDADDFLFG